MAKKKGLEATYGSPDKPLIIGNIEIPCYVLDDGRRVIVQLGLFKALGITKGGSSLEKYKEYGGGARIVSFLDQNTIKPLSSTDFKAVLKTPIVFSVNKTPHYGYEATLLQEMVRSISKEYLRGNLSKRHEAIGANAEMLDDAFAKVGIIALIDEATGYQKVRDRDALLKILEAYINPTLLPWTKRFPDEFYKEIFRLNGWAYDPGNVKRPGVIGIWTNNVIYKHLPDGVLEELKKTTPKGKHLHRGLTTDVGHPHLSNQLAAVTAIMRMSSNWKKFKENFAKAFNRGQQSLDLDTEDTPE